MDTRALRIEWPTVALVLGCSLVWMLATYAAGRYGWWPFLGVAIVCTTLHASCQHEMLHGHPTRNRLVNEALVFAGPGLFYPYRRFKTLHLQHHNDPNLTDPYDDPESNFMAKADWDLLPPPIQRLRQVNNTFVGRMLIGPLIAVAGFYLSDARQLATGNGRLWKDWLLHAVGVAIVLWWVMAVCGLGFWTYVLAVAYPAFSLLSVRTFLEHRAERDWPLRTCIVEDKSGFWGLLFLNNNLHVVHHELPSLAWYKIPGLYWADKQRYIAKNGGYFFPGYGAIAARYAFTTKAPVPHPFLRRET